MECGGAHTSAFIQKYDEDDALTALQLDFKLAGTSKTLFNYKFCATEELLFNLVALQVSLSPQASSSQEVSSRELRGVSFSCILHGKLS